MEGNEAKRRALIVTVVALVTVLCVLCALAAVLSRDGGQIAFNTARLVSAERAARIWM